MLDGGEADATALAAELENTRRELLDEEEVAGARFLAVLQARCCGPAQNSSHEREAEPHCSRCLVGLFCKLLHVDSECAASLMGRALIEWQGFMYSRAAGAVCKDRNIWRM